MPADARFCGNCGAAPPGGTATDEAGAGTDPTQVGGASTWQGVAPVVERDPTEVLPPAGPPPGGPPLGPPAGGPPPGAPPTAGGKGRGPLIAAILVVLALLAGGAFFLLGGDDDGDEDDVAIEREDRDDAEETTTTTEAEETTTTAEADATTTTAPEDGGGGEELTFTQVQDDSGALVLEVPDFWTVDGRPLGDGAPNVIAAEDLTAFTTELASSGVSYTRLAAPNADPDTTIDFVADTKGLFEACTVGERVDYSDGVFTGRRQQFDDCGASGIQITEIVGTRADGVSVQVTIGLMPGDDPGIVDRIEQTFNLTT
jgi:hypothetical protein